jgi:hypothetical protein
VCLQVFSFSPGVTYTGMVPETLPSFAKQLLRRLLFSPEAALYAPLYALFSPDLLGGAEYWSNTPVLRVIARPQSVLMGEWLLSLTRRYTAARSMMFAVIVLYQQHMYGRLTVSPVHPACGDAALTAGLFQWSVAEVHRYSFAAQTQEAGGNGVDLLRDEQEAEGATVITGDAVEGEAGAAAKERSVVDTTISESPHEEL